jgi:site-specific DNA-cytosine methylase
MGNHQHQTKSKGICTRGSPTYHIEHRVLNTFKIGALPQHRPRIYIVGVTKKLLPAQGKDFSFQWPSEVPAPKLTHFLGPNREPKWTPTGEGQVKTLMANWKKIRDHESRDPSRVMFVVDIGASEKFSSYQYERVPTLTRSRAGMSAGFYLTAWNRCLTSSEILRLQGFPTTLKRAGATDRQIRQMAGNAMSVPVLARVMGMVLMAAANYITEDDIESYP